MPRVYEGVKDESDVCGDANTRHRMSSAAHARAATVRAALVACRGGDAREHVRAAGTADTQACGKGGDNIRALVKLKRGARTPRLCGMECMTKERRHAPAREQ